MKKGNHFFRIAAWAFVGAFIGTTIYRIYDYVSHPGLYALQSTPWYSSILVNAGFTAIVVAILLIIKQQRKNRVNGFPRSSKSPLPSPGPILRAMALSFAQPQVECPGPVGAPPCRSLQPLRSGQPAARVGPFQLSSPAPASTRKKVVATASRRKTTASNNLDPLSRARPWSALPRCCVNIAVRVAPTEQASRASLFHGHGTGAVCLGFAAMAPPGAAEEGARSRRLR